MRSLLNPLYAALAIGAGFAAGVINTLAGNGSAITLPLLVFLGLPPTVANGTNRIGVLAQCTVSTVAFQRKGMMPWRLAAPLLAAVAIGGLIGATIAVDLNETNMYRAIGAMLVLSFFLILLRPERWLHSRVDGSHPSRPRDWLIFLVIGIYGGFIQAGVGIFLLTALVLSIGLDMVRGNAVKSVLTLALNITAFIVFVRNDQVDWGLGLLVASGQVLGAWVAAHFAMQEWAQVWVYRLVLVVIMASAVQMFLR